ncbi:hypothetical protein NDU88_004453 [Pleurodeles waltl]|uniref:Uncharacterized protein n=1 Tax=Pleurodeles waltl TaxID=8319 RepID=A0AAV7UGU3_PLEWA|nr:hypothetical protein NDU88_004453 [Pleurodeles waltl]
MCLSCCRSCQATKLDPRHRCSPLSGLRPAPVAPLYASDQGAAPNLQRPPKQGPGCVPAAVPLPHQNLLRNCVALPAVAQEQQGSRRSTGKSLRSSGFRSYVSQVRSSRSMLLHRSQSLPRPQCNFTVNVLHFCIKALHI